MWLVILLLLTIVFIIVATTRLKLHPFLALLIAAFGYGLLCGKMSPQEVVESVNAGFGGTIGYIGIVILAGSVIGTFLEKSGGAVRLAQRILQLVGHKNVPLAMGIIGYIVSIPVFCDAGFVILWPLAKSLSARAKTSLAATAVALSLGLYATHTMVPPTPGPVAAAGILKADLGLVILWGLFVGIFALAAAWVFSIKYAARVDIKAESESSDAKVRLPPSQPLRRSRPGGVPWTTASEQPDIENIPAQAPSAFKSVIPIFLPILLIVLRSVSDFPNHPFGQGGLAGFIEFAGQPVVALLAGVFLAFLLPKKLTAQMLSPSGWVGEAVLAVAAIIIITGCGGAFGKVLQNSGVSEFVAERLGGKNLSIALPFLMAAALKTAQGSSTVAIITTAGTMAPLIESLGLADPTGRALTVVAIGAGSMVVSHANDSYFWVVTGLSKMSVKQGYKLQTLGTLVQGIAAGFTLWIISLIVR
jgi:GntP family gluconate:H+ symporter